MRILLGICCLIFSVASNCQSADEIIGVIGSDTLISRLKGFGKTINGKMGFKVVVSSDSIPIDVTLLKNSFDNGIENLAMEAIRNLKFCRPVPKKELGNYFVLVRVRFKSGFRGLTISKSRSL